MVVYTSNFVKILMGEPIDGVCTLILVDVLLCKYVGTQYAGCVIFSFDIPELEFCTMTIWVLY